MFTYDGRWRLLTSWPKEEAVAQWRVGAEVGRCHAGSATMSKESLGAMAHRWCPLLFLMLGGGAELR